MDKELESAIENPVQFLSQPQQERDWDMSIEDIARSINYNPYETLLTKAEREPKKYNWVQTALRAVGSSIEDMGITASQSFADQLGVYSSPNMTKEQADRLTEDIIYLRNFEAKARQAEDLPYMTSHPDIYDFSSGVGSFLGFVLAELAHPAYGTFTMFESSRGQMQRELADKYIESTGSVEGYADRKSKDDMLSTGYALLNTAIERALGMERLVGAVIRNPAKYATNLTAQKLLGYGAKIASGFVQEFAEEGIQSPLEDATQIAAGYGAWEDLLKKESFQKAIRSATMGGIVGAAAGGVLHRVGRARAKAAIAEWADKHQLNLSDAEVTQVTNAIVDGVQTQVLDDLTARAELKMKNGQAFDTLTEKVKEVVRNTGTPMAEEALDEYARTVAKTLQIPAQNLSLWSALPISEYLNAAEIRVTNGIWELAPITSSADVKTQIDQQNAIIKEQNKLKKLGTENTGVLNDAKRRKNVLEAIYDSMIKEEQFEEARIELKKKEMGITPEQDALPEQDAKRLEGSQDLSAFVSKMPEAQRTELTQNGTLDMPAVRKRYENAMLSWVANNDKKAYNKLAYASEIPQRIIEPLALNGASIVELQAKYPDLDIRGDIYNALQKYQRTTKDNFVAVMQEQELNGRDVMPENVMLWNFIFANNTTIGMFLDNYTKIASANREMVARGDNVAPLSKKDLYAQALKQTDDMRAQIAAENNSTYEPLFSETGEIKDINLQSAFISYQNQFNTPAPVDTKLLNQEQFDLADENARLDDIYPAYDGETINIDGKERTVYNSNGDRIAKSKEALTNFWRWFGDSKVVDKKGRPLVMHHGTKTEFEEFYRSSDIGFHFGSKGAARIKAGRGKQAVVYNVYLKIQNPLKFDRDLGNWDAAKDSYLATELLNMGIITQEQFNGLRYNFGSYGSSNAILLRNALKEKGFDGIEYPNYYEDTGKISYIAFEPTQIKSVDNRGTYSSDTGNIYLQKRNLVNAWYDPDLQIIALTKNWNNLSLVHEMHHHYLAKLLNVYNQAEAGIISLPEAGKAEIRNLFDMLDIPDPTSVTREQLNIAQERFASMTEAYLTGLGVQESENQVYKDFLKWIPEKYKSILNIGYLNEKNEIVNPLLDQKAIDFFNKWFSEPQMPVLPTSPDSQSLVNPTDDKDEIIPSSQKEMNDREIKWGIDSAEQIDADKKLYASIDENTEGNLRAAIDGAKVMLDAQPREDTVTMPKTKRKRWFETGKKDAQQRMAEKAREYVAKNPEHAKELALADPEISTVYDAPIDRAWLIRAVMETVDQNSPEYAIMYDNLATYRSMSGSTLGLTNDMSQKAYLDAKREIENAREVKAAINYAGNNRGSWDKWTGDIKSFINARAAKIMETAAGSQERKVALRAFLEEAKTKFSANTTDSTLNQLDLTGVNARTKAVFIKWAEKAIRQTAGVGLTNEQQAKLIQASTKAQNAMLAIDNPDSAMASAAARDLRNWQVMKDELKKSNFGRFDKFNNAVNNLMGGYVPSAMLMSFNTLFVANIPSTAINNAIVRSSAQKIYGKQAVSKPVLEAEKKRIRDIFSASGMNLAQMEKPTSPSLMHGEKYMGQDKSHWYDFTFKILSWGDNLFRIPTFVDTLGRIASKNANGDTKLATEKFRQYSQLNNQDEEAQIARKQALAVANMAVFTQDGTLAAGLNHVRSEINKMSRGLLGLEKEGFGLGNLLSPFLKTGANVVETGVTGALAPVRQLAFWLRQLNGKEIPDLQKIALRNDWKVFTWTALSVALLSALTSDDEELYIEPYEYGRKYDPARPYDSINIAGALIKLDTFGVFSTPIRIAVKLIKEKSLFKAYGFGLQEAMGEAPLLNQLTSDPSYMFKQPEKWAQGFAYSNIMKFVPAQLKTVTKVASKEAGIEYKPEWAGKYLQRRFNRNYGFDGVAPTTNDYINVLTNRLKFIE